MSVRRISGLVALVWAAVLAQAPRSMSSLDLAARVDKVDVAGREPMAVEHPDGSLFVAAYGVPPRPVLWKSSDRGANWTRADLGAEADGAVGNSDVALAVSQDGTLYFANLLFDRGKMEGRQVSVAASRDAGISWRWSTVAKGRFVDRPWVGVGGDGVAHVIWSDANGVHHSSSLDRGLNWSEGPLVFHTGGSSHFAAGPRGELAVRISPSYAGGLKFARGVDLIAVSTDSGMSWRRLPAPGERRWSEDEDSFPPRWVEPLAWDSDAALYSFWTNAKGLWLARSTNRGRSWTTWNLAKSQQPAYYPYLVAGGRGQLAASWYSGRSDSLRLHVARIDASAPGKPRLIEAEPVQLDSWSRDNPQQRDPAGEYAGIVLLREGGIGAAAPIFNTAAKRFGFTWLRFIER